VAAVISVAALKLLPVPFAWIGLLWCGVLVAGSVAAASPSLKALGVAGATVCLTSAVAEVVLASRLPPELTRFQVPRLSQPDPALGWRLVSPLASRNTVLAGERTVYDVVYTVESGRRVAPPDDGRPVPGCAVFLADSFTFGIGVHDWEAYPYRVGMLAGGRVRAVNLAVPGYGVEQVVASLEQGVFARQTPCPPTHVVYLALPHHVLRAAGRTAFSRRSPRYELDASGVPVYRGTPSPPAEPNAGGKLVERAVEQLDKSNLRRLLALRREPRPTEADLRLYFALVRRIRELLASQYPDAELHVLAWGLHGWFGGGVDRFRAGLRAVVPRVHVVEDVLPRYAESPHLYALDPLDEHPNARAHEIIADYVADRILSPSGR